MAQRRLGPPLPAHGPGQRGRARGRSPTSSSACPTRASGSSRHGRRRQRRPAPRDRLLFRARPSDEAGDGGRCRNSQRRAAGRPRRPRCRPRRRTCAPRSVVRCGLKYIARAHVPRGPRDRAGRARRGDHPRPARATSAADEERRNDRPTSTTRLARAGAGRSTGADTVALACHVNPDGDALGSMLGLFHVLRAAGRDVVASFPPPFVVAPHYRELPGLDLLTKPEDFPAAPDVMVTFDCGSLGRLGDLEPAAEGRARADRARPPHLEHRYGTINVIDPDAAASGVLVRRLVDELGPRRSTDDAAVCALRRARLRHRALPVRDHHAGGVRPRARARRVRRARSSRLSRQLFEEHRFAYLKLLGEALADAELDVEQRFVWTAVTQDMLDRHGVTLEEVEGLIDILRRTTEAEVTCVREGGARRHRPGEPALARRRRRAPRSPPPTAAAATASPPASRRRSTSTTVVARIRAAL